MIVPSPLHNFIFFPNRLNKLPPPLPRDFDHAWGLGVCVCKAGGGAKKLYTPLIIPLSCLFSLITFSSFTPQIFPVFKPYKWKEYEPLPVGPGGVEALVVWEVLVVLLVPLEPGVLTQHGGQGRGVSDRVQHVERSCCPCSVSNLNTSICKLNHWALLFFLN